jgi:hypothetical protein
MRISSLAYRAAHVTVICLNIADSRWTTLLFEKLGRHSAGQEIALIFYITKDHYRVHINTPLDSWPVPAESSPHPQILFI